MVIEILGSTKVLIEGRAVLNPVSMVRFAVRGILRQVLNVRAGLDCSKTRILNIVQFLDYARPRASTVLHNVAILVGATIRERKSISHELINRTLTEICFDIGGREGGQKANRGKSSQLHVEMLNEGSIQGSHEG